ncbi:hypothetical protein [Listeria grandensis]|uniref:hypothetical protein n=1 Tax=Listeria grandensis TaxID=1494963 RepID=UPI00164CFC1C|nr:hypothetical protein [Listeria grandensis]MBC6316960.1 hypothetical protein [Listeria grandensis]
MKKWQIILGSILFLFLVTVGGYMIYAHINTKQADAAINKVIKEAGIPENEIIVVEKTTYNQKILSSEWCTKTITTEKDYQNWKKEVKQQQHFFNGEKVTSKNISRLDSKTNCELQYLFMFYKNPSKVNGYYVISGNSVGPDKAKYIFAYTLPKNNLAY